MKKENIGSHEEGGYSRRFSRGKVGQPRIGESVEEEGESEIVYAEQMRDVVKFGGMGLNEGEIQLACLIVRREEISPGLVHSLLQRAERGKDPLNSAIRTRKHASIDGDSAAEVSKDKVLALVIANERLIVANATEPRGKSEWEKVVKAMGDIDKPLHIVKHLLRRGASLPDAMQIAKLDIGTLAEEPIVKFAQDLVDSNMISSDLSDHLQVMTICKKKHIQLPIAYGIALEAFIYARRGIKTNSLKLLNKYQELRDRWLNEESEEANRKKQRLLLGNLEDFIGEGEDHLGYKVDTLGSYRGDSDGNRFRTPIGISDNGHITYDNPDLERMRKASRARIGGSRLRSKPSNKTRAEALWDRHNPLDTES